MTTLTTRSVSCTQNLFQIQIPGGVVALQIIYVTGEMDPSDGSISAGPNLTGGIETGMNRNIYTKYTGCPVKHVRVFLVPCKKCHVSNVCV